MKLEDQVCSLSLSKQLKELGVKQDSVLFHYRIKDSWDLGGSVWHKLQSVEEKYSAFTVAELGDILPAVVRISEDESAWFASDKSEEGTWLANYGDNGMISIDEVAKTEADSRALMLIHLIEEGLTKV